MRISDWSSDVCSSDLRVSLSLADPALVEDDQADSDAGTMLRIGAAENRDLDARAGNFGDGDIADRKSVGSGKSGSVRVDLGGRRIITKKKRKIMIILKT